jgi:hypothetical protein
MRMSECLGEKVEGSVAQRRGVVMKPEEVHIGTTVRVQERHRVAERRGTVGRIADHYGRDGYITVDVRFPDRQYRLFRPEDLEEISPPRPWWRSLLAGG